MSWIEYFWKWLSTALPTPLLVTNSIVLILTLIGLAIKSTRPEWIGRMDKLAWQIPLGLLIVIFFTSMAVSSYNIYKEQKSTIQRLEDELSIARKQTYPPVATLMMEQFFKDRDIPLAEFGLVNHKLIGKTFENCRIHGPIVIQLLRDNEIGGSRFYGNTDSNFIITTNKTIGGVLALERCTFIGCDFINISFIGNEDQISFFKKGFKMKNPT